MFGAWNGLSKRNRILGGPKTSQKSTSQDVVVQTSDTCFETASVLHKEGTGRQHVSDENVGGIFLCPQSSPSRQEQERDLQEAPFASTDVVRKMFPSSYA